MKRRITALISMIATALVLVFTGAAVQAATTYNLGVKNRSADSFVLTWDEQKGADCYRVYVYNEYTRSYKKYRTVAHEKCTFTRLDPSTTYKIKVMAMEKVKGKYRELSESGAVTVTTMGILEAEEEVLDLTPQKKPATKVSDLRKWDHVYENCGNESMANGYITSYLNKFRNAGYTVELGYSGATSHRILFNGEYVGTAYTYKTAYIPYGYTNYSFLVETYFGEGNVSRPSAFSSYVKYPAATNYSYYYDYYYGYPYYYDYYDYYKGYPSYYNNPIYLQHKNDSRYVFTDTGYYFNGVFHSY